VFMHAACASVWALRVEWCLLLDQCRQRLVPSTQLVPCTATAVAIMVMRHHDYDTHMMMTQHSRPVTHCMLPPATNTC
jgi:hypothetical protein